MEKRAAIKLWSCTQRCLAYTLSLRVRVNYLHCRQEVHLQAYYSIEQEAVSRHKQKPSWIFCKGNWYLDIESMHVYIFLDINQIKATPVAQLWEEEISSTSINLCSTKAICPAGRFATAFTMVWIPSRLIKSWLKDEPAWKAKVKTSLWKLQEGRTLKGNFFAPV